MADNYASKTFELSKHHTETLTDSSDDDNLQKPRRQHNTKKTVNANSISNYAIKSSKKRKSVITDNETSVSKFTKQPRIEVREFSKGDEDEDSDSAFSAPSFIRKKPEIKKPALDYGVGRKIMEGFGYKDGEGLGKSKQGRVEPISESMQHGRRGLGFVPASQGKPYEGREWNPKEEIVTINETPNWIEDSSPEELDRDTLDNWISTGKPKLFINDETNFCDPKILDDILSLKTVFDDIKSDVLHTLVGCCNLYEPIKSVFFMNRAAVKMANMDAVFDFMFTEPLTEGGVPVVKDDELLYFADVCAGPGGFTEYVLWRKKWTAKGFGFTLKRNCDFNINGMRAAPTESFFPYYGQNDTGDIFDPENLISLKDFVLKNTDEKGVHFLMADGGFSVEGEENIQEIKSKQLYLCQCIAALSLVRNGGHFVVKLFDVFTKFSIGLIYLMYKSFKKICIHKPITSRPANSERYLICKWKRETPGTIERHLFYVNEIMWRNSQEKVSEDILELVPMEILTGDVAFYDYIVHSNNNIGGAQINSLLKISGLHKDRTLLNFITYDDNLTHEQKKVDIRRRALEFWKVPDEPKREEKLKKISNFDDPLKFLNINFCQNNRYNIKENTLIEVLLHQQKKVEFEKDILVEPHSKSFIKSPYDWYFMFGSMKEPKCNFYLGLGRHFVYKLEGKHWNSCNSIYLPEGTLIYAEQVDEKRGRGQGIHSSPSLHIIDAFRLGHENVFNLDFEKRNLRIKLFCDAINKPQIKNSDTYTVPVRSKNYFKLVDIHNHISKLDERKMKNGSIALTASIPNMKDNNDAFFVVDSLFFVKFTKDPWSMFLSKTHNTIYYFNFANNMNTYNIVDGSYNNAFDAFLSGFRSPLFKDAANYNFLLRDRSKN